MNNRYREDAGVVYGPGDDDYGRDTTESRDRRLKEIIEKLNRRWAGEKLLLEHAKKYIKKVESGRGRPQTHFEEMKRAIGMIEGITIDGAKP